MKRIARAWAVVCKDGEFHRDSEGLWVTDRSKDLKSWVVYSGINRRDSCGPHRIVKLVEQKRKGRKA